MTVLLGSSGTGVNSANSNLGGTAFASRLVALASGMVTTIQVRSSDAANATQHAAIYADNAGALTGAARLSGDVSPPVAVAGWLVFTINPGVSVVAGQFYWLEFMGTGGFNYTDFATSGGTERDTSGLSTLAATHPTTTASFTNVFNCYADGVVVSQAVSPLLSMYLKPGLSRARAIQLLHPPAPAVAAAPTLLSDSDSGTATDTGTVAATVPGAESGTGSDSGTASVTASGSDSGTGTDAGSVVQPTVGSDSGTGTEAGTVSAAVPGSESSSSTDTGTVSATASSSDAATGTDAGVPSVTGSSSDTGSGADTGTANVTAAGSDSATGVDDGTVVDLAATLVSGSDAGVGTDSGAVVDLTPPPVEEPDLGDQGSIYGSSAVDRSLRGWDAGVGWDVGVVVDLTRRPAPRRVLPRPSRLGSSDAGEWSEIAVVASSAVSQDLAHGDDVGVLVDLTPELIEREEEDDMLVLLGLLSD